MKVSLTKDAHKEFKALPHAEQTKIKRKLKELVQHPFAGKKLSGQLANRYSLRAWPYRILYLIEKEEIYVTVIAHRQSAYK